MQVDFLALGLPGCECVALQHPRHGHLAHKLDHVGAGHRRKPFAVAADFQLVARKVEHLARLLEVGSGVGLDFLRGEHRACFGPSTRITDHGRIVADDEDRLVTEVLKLPQLPQHHGMAEGQVRCRGVHSKLDAQPLPRRQTRRKLLNGVHVIAPAQEKVQLL